MDFSSFSAYKRLSKAADVSATDVQAISVTANLKNTKGEGTPTFYQFQYRVNTDVVIILICI
jgi:hypothetical protein